VQNGGVLTEAIRRFFGSHELTPQRVVVAVSGGFDSTALLLAMAELRQELDVVVAHVNHHLRGEESDGDEAFVRELCARLGLALHVADGTLDPVAVRERGIEAAAREVRFARLHDIRRAVDAGYIATAHQKNDQAETVLMRLMHGGSPAALQGIHPVRADGVIRPLLDVRRRDIVTWLEERGVHPRIDRSNSDPRFLRNHVRKLLSNAPPSAIDNLAQSAAQARAQWHVLERAVDAAEDAEVGERETRFRSMPGDLWLRQALLHRHIVRLDPAHARDVSARDLERLASKCSPAVTGPVASSDDDSAEKPRSRWRCRVSVTGILELLVEHDGAVVLRCLPQPPVPFDVPLAPGRPAEINGMTIDVQREHADRQRSTDNEQRTTNNDQRPLDNEQRIQLPSGATADFVVRSRRPGDRFQPLGWPAPAKLKDFLINRKVPREQRDWLPLVTWNGEIAWIPGVAVSERFRTNGGDGDVYLLSSRVQSRS
jgi:tRNA(Ile)-lysidine synthase